MMNISIAKEKLTHLLYLCNSIVERRNTMPILANVRLSAKNNTLSVAATDLEISLTGEAEAEVNTPGEITVGAKMLFEIVRELPNDSVTLKVNKSQRLEVESGQSRFKINGISSDEYPSIAGVNLENPIAVDASKLYEMLDKSGFAVSTDETRYNINGVYIETLNSPVGKDKQGIRFVATDGHRLAMVDRPAEGLSFPAGVIIPRKGIQELRKVLENNDGAAKVSFHEGFFTVQSNNATIGIRLVDGQFPDYRQVVPVENKTTITVDKSELLSAVKRVSLVTTDKSKTIKFKLVDGNVLISSQSPEHGEASENLQVQQEGEDVTIGFSARYMTDVLNAMSKAETVTIQLNGDLGPGVFRGSDDEHFTCIVMPMRFD